MKKLIIAAAFILLTGIAFGQTLQKGNLVGIHIVTLNLNPDVTLNQYLDFVINKVIPEYEKNFPDIQYKVAKGIRGEHANSFAYFVVFESEEVRNKYWSKEGEFTELGTSAMGKMELILSKLDELGTASTSYTDWLIK
jgi:hypothetical protein